MPFSYSEISQEYTFQQNLVFRQQRNAMSNRWEEKFIPLHAVNI